MIRFIWNGNVMLLNADLISSFEVRQHKVKVTMSNGDSWEWQGEEAKDALTTFRKNVIIRNPDYYDD